jgi:hypothetical protein
MWSDVYKKIKKGYKLFFQLVALSFLLEAATGFEPVNNGFADRRLTTWLCRLLERETGFEPATSTLARLHSTAELFPPIPSFLSNRYDGNYLKNYKICLLMSIVKIVGEIGRNGDAETKER